MHQTIAVSVVLSTIGVRSDNMTINVNNYFQELSNDELATIIEDILAKESRGGIGRCETLVPFAEAMRDNIGDNYNVRIGLEYGQHLALVEFAKRNINEIR